MPTPIDLTELCPHFDDGYTTKAICSKCNGSEDRKPTVVISPMLDVTAVFEAKYAGRCNMCDGTIEPGDMMCRLSDGEYVCGECGGVEQL